MTSCADLELTWGPIVQPQPSLLDEIPKLTLNTLFLISLPETRELLSLSLSPMSSLPSNHNHNNLTQSRPTSITHSKISKIQFETFINFPPRRGGSPPHRSSDPQLLGPHNGCLFSNGDWHDLFSEPSPAIDGPSE
ncbi:hypothetical protein RchiOBHm_Chr0c45g0503821 [Rosa chinensis]|uniref:Uncharacterized protein n=1 Tax=Rosa chinensis TaxID=74649 RepID=A0A2P6SQ16_ROSCH|nr:hypothetical protein RchiOBHm_Chr0c45g0503821 [Rosa chinensis]